LISGECLEISALFSKLEVVYQYFKRLRMERSAIKEGELTAEEAEEFVAEVELEQEVFISVSSRDDVR